MLDLFLVSTVDFLHLDGIFFAHCMTIYDCMRRDSLPDA